MVWTKNLMVWIKSERCEQNVDGVIKKFDGVIKFFDGVNKIFTVWTIYIRCDKKFDGVIKNLTVWSKLRWCDQDIFGVIKRPFAGNCVITPCGVIISHVFFWCRGSDTAQSSRRPWRIGLNPTWLHLPVHKYMEKKHKEGPHSAKKLGSWTPHPN